MAFYALWDQTPRSPVFLMQFPSTPHKPTRDNKHSTKVTQYKNVMKFNNMVYFSDQIMDNLHLQSCLSVE